MRRRFVLYILMMLMILMLSSCNEITESPLESTTHVISQSPEPSMTEVIPTPTQSQEPIVTHTPTPTPTPTPIWSPVPSESQPPQKPTEYTDEQYFYFDALHGTILDYDIAGGEYVSIPETIGGVTVKTIGEHAFEYKKLYGVIIPDNVTKISDYAFYNCGIQELELGESVEYIGRSAFYNSRKSYIPRIGDNPLYNYQSDGLKTLTLPNSVRYIGYDAFGSNSLTSITIPQGVEYLSGFNNNNLSEVTISDTVKKIAEGAFSHNLLTSVVIPKGVEYVSGFANNKLSNVTIPESVKHIAINAFARNLLTSVVIPHGVEYLSGFSYNNLSEVTIPDSVINIDDYAFTFNSLTSVVIPHGVEYLSGFDNNKLSEVTIPDSVTDIGDYAFRSNRLTNVTIPDSVINIGAGAFIDNLLKNITIPDSVTNIETYAFSNILLESVTIPDSVTYIGKNAFLGVVEDKVKLGAGVSSYFVIEGDSIVGHICSVKEKLVIPYYEGVTKIAAHAFENRNDIFKVEISEGIKIIHHYAFKDTNVNGRYHSVLLPDSIQYIANMAFSGSKSMFEYTSGSFAEYLIYGPNYTNRSSLTNHLYNFPIDRQGIINEDIAIDIKTEDVSFGNDWIRRYICSKYMDKEITRCDVGITIPSIYNIADRTLYDGHTIKAQEYQITLRAVNDIEGLTRNESGEIKIKVQAVFVTDNIKGRFILSGIIPESEMIDTRQELYDYIKADNRFTLGEYIPEVSDTKHIPTLAENQNAITKVDLINCPVISELTKDIVYGQVNTGNIEEYLPIGDDKVVFYIPAPVYKLYMVNYRSNEIIWSHDYPDAKNLSLNYTKRYSDEINEVFQFYYSVNDTYLNDFIDIEGKIIAQSMGFDSYENPIPGTKWKVINDDYNVYLKDTETDSVYMVLCANKTDWPVENYIYQKALDENRFVYQKITSGEGMFFYHLFVYDIRDGSSTQIEVNDFGYYLFSNDMDEYVTSAVVYGGGGSQPTMFIYDDEIKKFVDIKSFANDFAFIVDYSLSKDGRYAALLTGEIGDYFEIVRIYVANSILLIDLETKEVLLQDSLTLNGGSISFLSDNTLVINDNKMLMYIDVPGLE